MTAQPQAPLDQSRPFTRAAALRGGLATQLRTAAYRRLFHGVYIASSVEVTPLIRAEAALLPFGKNAWASHASAARIHRLPIPALPDEHVTVADPKDRRSRDGVICRYAAHGQIQYVEGVPVSSQDRPPRVG